MTGPEIVINVGYALAFGVAGITAIRLSLPKRPSEAERVAQAKARVGRRVWDSDTEKWVRLPPGTRPGPRQLTEAEVAALDDLAIAWDAPVFDPATDPRWAAARARLFADLNHDQQTGEQA